jgi:hypothetical protein
MKRKIFFSVVAVLFALLLVIMGAVIGMSLQSSNTPATITPGNDNQGIDVGEPNPNTPTDEDIDTTVDEDETPVVVDEMSDFASTRYNIQFKYPKSFGEHKVTVNTGYFFNEKITFPNSEITATYVRVEGSMGSNSDGSVTTKQGYTGGYDIAQGGPNNNYGISVFIPSPGTNGTRLFFDSNASTQAGAEQELAKIQDILDTLEFDFSNVPMGGCETSCR